MGSGNRPVQPFISGPFIDLRTAGKAVRNLKGAQYDGFSPFNQIFTWFLGLNGPFQGENGLFLSGRSAILVISGQMGGVQNRVSEEVQP